MQHQKYIIESERLYCRLFTMDDLDGFHGLNGDEKVMKYIRPVITFEESKLKLENSIAEYITKPELLRYALIEKATDTFVGCFVIFPLQDYIGEQGIQVGYSLLPPYWSKGYATEITKAGMEYAYSIMGVTELYGVTTANHKASQQVLIKNGFVLAKEYTEEDEAMHLYKSIKTNT